jgi:hypothetical protein
MLVAVLRYHPVLVDRCVVSGVSLAPGDLGPLRIGGMDGCWGWWRCVWYPFWVDLDRHEIDRA